MHEDLRCWATTPNSVRRSCDTSKARCTLHPALSTSWPWRECPKVVRCLVRTEKHDSSSDNPAFSGSSAGESFHFSSLLNVPACSGPVVAWRNVSPHSDRGRCRSTSWSTVATVDRHVWAPIAHGVDSEKRLFFCCTSKPCSVSLRSCSVSLRSCSVSLRSRGVSLPTCSVSLHSRLCWGEMFSECAAPQFGVPEKLSTGSSPIALLLREASSLSEGLWQTKQNASKTDVTLPDKHWAEVSNVTDPRLQT